MTPVAENRLPSSVPVLRRALLWGLLANAGIAIIGGVLGALTAGTSGAVSAVIGAAMAATDAGVINSMASGPIVLPSAKSTAR